MEYKWFRNTDGKRSETQALAVQANNFILKLHDIEVSCPRTRPIDPTRARAETSSNSL